MKPPVVSFISVFALLVAGIAASPYKLDLDMVRDAVSQAMRCYGIEKVQLGVGLQDKTQHKIRLQLNPDGTVSELGEDVKFLIASVSKGMFSVALAEIERHLKAENRTFSLFTTPVKEWFGDDFWFLDHERTKMLTIDDMVSHSTGLARHDLMWYLEGWKTKQEIFRYTGRLKPATPYRASFVYNNLVWTIADLAVEHLTKKNFTTYMRDFLWNPLGMKDTYGVSELTISQMKSLAASRSYRSTGIPTEISALHSTVGSVEAAGGIATTLNDMLTYGIHLISKNYTSLIELPQEFKPINPYVGQGIINAFLHSEDFNVSITDPPQAETESYTRGWIRSWYRDNLVYTHTGSLHGIRSEINVYLKRGFLVFNHMTFGATKNPLHQMGFAGLLNTFVSDLMLQNSSFITKDNICHLFKEFKSSQNTSIPRRHLSDSELSTVIGRYSSYGFGTAQVLLNQTTNALTLVYGIGKLELIPIRLTDSNRFEFFIEILEPVEVKTENVMSRTDDFIHVPQDVLQSPQAFLLIEQDDSSIRMQSVLFEANNLLTKNLDISQWTRPQLCPESKASEKANGAMPLTMFALAVVLVTLRIKIY